MDPTDFASAPNILNFRCLAWHFYSVGQERSGEIIKIQEADVSGKGGHGKSDKFCHQ